MFLTRLLVWLLEVIQERNHKVRSYVAVTGLAQAALRRRQMEYRPFKTFSQAP